MSVATRVTALRFQCASIARSSGDAVSPGAGVDAVLSPLAEWPRCSLRPAAWDRASLRRELLFFSALLVVSHPDPRDRASAWRAGCLESDHATVQRSLLLHCVGAHLADNRPDFMATGPEWRTPPLWGIGLVNTASGHRAPCRRKGPKHRRSNSSGTDARQRLRESRSATCRLATARPCSSF